MRGRRWAIYGIANTLAETEETVVYFQFLVEDASSAALIEALMSEKIPPAPDFSYKIKYFHGIGGFRKKKTVKEIKTGKLLNDLEIYLSAFDKNLQGLEAAVFVVLDNDDRDTKTFRRQLAELAERRNISVDHVFCIAIEEVEAWLLGNRQAVLQAYPKANKKSLLSYQQDSICGTWERLADVVHPGWLKRIKKENLPYAEIGTEKSKWAREIGVCMCPDANASPSFQYFWREVLKRLAVV